MSNTLQRKLLFSYAPDWSVILVHPRLHRTHNSIRLLTLVLACVSMNHAVAAVLTVSATQRHIPFARWGPRLPKRLFIAGQIVCLAILIANIL